MVQFSFLRFIGWSQTRQSRCWCTLCPRTQWATIFRVDISLVWTNKIKPQRCFCLQCFSYVLLYHTCSCTPRQITATAPCPLRPRTTPFSEEKSILGVLHGVLLWADMNAATALGAWGRCVITLVWLRICVWCALQIRGQRARRQRRAAGLVRVSIAPISLRNFIGLNNISIIVRYLYEKPPHNNRKCG